MIKLLRFDREDFDQLISWSFTPEILLQFAGPDFDFPLTIDQLDRSIKSAGRHSYKVVDTSTGESIGHAEIVVMNRNAHLCRILIGNEKLRGKGIGQEIVHELLRKSFGEMDCKTASLYVYDWNMAAIQCYKKAGFTVTDEERKTTNFEDKLWVALRMVNSRKKWEAIQREG